MHAFVGQGVQIHRRGRGQGLALTGAHLSDLTVVHHDPAKDLDVEGALPQDPPGGLADRRVGVEQQVVQRLAVCQSGLELCGPSGQFCV